MKLLLATSLLALSSFAVAAQEGVTADALLKDGFEVKAAFATNAGPALVLQKADQVTMCFVAETPDSADIATQYCKPVH